MPTQVKLIKNNSTKIAAAADAILSQDPQDAMSQGQIKLLAELERNALSWETDKYKHNEESVKMPSLMM